MAACGMNTEVYRMPVVQNTHSGQGRCAPRRRSLLRSCLAARSLPRRPPAYVLSARRRNPDPCYLAPVDFGYVGVVLVERSCEEVAAAAVGRRDEVHVVGLGWLEDGPNRSFAGVANGGGG